jgi:hypothetical protein
MASIEEIQAAYYMVAATGVLVAAVFYILNLREQRRNMRLTLETRKIGLIQEITRSMSSVEGQMTTFELMNYNWKDYDDFDKRYGSDSNPEAAAKRYSIWRAFNNMGGMLRKGVLNIEDLYDAIGPYFIGLWLRYKPIIDGVRERYNGQGYMRDFDFLVVEMVKYVRVRDPSFKVPDFFSKYVSDK